MEEDFGVMISTAQRQTERNNMLACTANQMTPDKPIEHSAEGESHFSSFIQHDSIYFT